MFPSRANDYNESYTQASLNDDSFTQSEAINEEILQNFYFSNFCLSNTHESHSGLQMNQQVIMMRKNTRQSASQKEENEKLTQLLKDKEKKIEEVIQEKEGLISEVLLLKKEKEYCLRQKEYCLRQKENCLRQKENCLREKENCVREKEDLKNENMDLMKQKEVEKREKQKFKRENERLKEEIQREKEKFIREKDEIQSEYESSLRQNRKLKNQQFATKINHKSMQNIAIAHQWDPKVQTGQTLSQHPQPASKQPQVSIKGSQRHQTHSQQSQDAHRGSQHQQLSPSQHYQRVYTPQQYAQTTDCNYHNLPGSMNSNYHRRQNSVSDFQRNQNTSGLNDQIVTHRNQSRITFGPTWQKNQLLKSPEKLFAPNEREQYKNKMMNFCPRTKDAEKTQK